MSRKSSFDTDAIFWEAIDKALLELGEPVKKTVVWHLSSRGHYIGSKQCSVRVFYSMLEELIGSGVDVIFNEVYAYLEKRFIAADIVLGFDPKSCPDCPLNRIERLLKMGDKYK